MPKTIRKKPGAPDQRLAKIAGIFEDISYEYWNRQIDYTGKVRVVPAPVTPDPKIEGMGDMICVGDPPFTLDPKGRPISNAGCLFLPGLVPEIPCPVFISCGVNHGEGYQTFNKAVEAIRGEPLSVDDQLRMVTEFHSPTRIIGEGNPDFLIRQENNPKGPELAEIGMLCAMQYLGIPAQRARVDVLDTLTRESFIRTGRRYLLEPVHRSSRDEIKYLEQNRGSTEYGVNFYYSPTGERYLTRDQLVDVIDEYRDSGHSAGDRKDLADRLSDISSLRKKMNEYQRLVLHRDVPELFFFEVDESRFNVGDVDDMMANVMSDMGDEALDGELDGFLERFTAATPSEYHHCDLMENPLFRSDMILTLRKVPHDLPYEARVTWVDPQGPEASKMLPHLRQIYPDHPINLGVMRHSASKRAIAGGRLTCIAEVFDHPNYPLLMHVRDSFFNPKECSERFRQMPDGSLVGRQFLHSRKDVSDWSENGIPLWDAMASCVSEEYIMFKGDRTRANKVLYGVLGSAEMMMASERLGNTSFNFREFDADLMPIDGRPTRTYGDLSDGAARDEAISDTKRIQSQFGKVIAVNMCAAASTLVGTGDELFNPRNPDIVVQTDATNCYLLEHLRRRAIDDPAQYVMASVYEASIELQSELMGATVGQVGEIRGVLLDSVVSSLSQLEDGLGGILDEADDVLYDLPRSELAGNNFNMPTLFLLSLARLVDPEGSDAPAFFDSLVEKSYGRWPAVFNPLMPHDTEILELIEGARQGDLYSPPDEVVKCISDTTDRIVAEGRLLIASEMSLENKTDLLDRFIVVLGTNPSRLTEAISEIQGDPPFNTLTFTEKMSRLRMVKLRQAITLSETRSIQEVEDYARESQSEAEGEDFFASTLKTKFPGLYFNQEDTRFFYRKANKSEFD